jgi:hypothetical protein
MGAGGRFDGLFVHTRHNEFSVGAAYVVHKPEATDAIQQA